MTPVLSHRCPDCDEPLLFAFSETSGLSAWKRGDAVNTQTDTWHYLCLPCAKAWKQRLSGPLTGDVVGDLAFFSCGRPDCGGPMAVTRESATPSGVELTCSAGHVYRLEPTDEGGVAIGEAT
jgi:hypothetical protein